MVLDGDGSEVDWVVGYDPPAEKFQERIGQMTAGVDTFKSLSAAYAKNPKDEATIFKLAQKWSDRYNDAKSQEKYKEILALDPDGKLGTTEFQKEKVSYTEYAEYNLGLGTLRARPPVPASILAFIKKYPESSMVKEAYRNLASAYFGRTAPKDEAVKFFEEYTARYAQDPLVLGAYVRRIIQDKDNLDKGLVLAQKAVDLAQGGAKIPMLQSLAQVHLLKGDKAKAAETAEKIVALDAEGRSAMMTMAPEGAPSGPVFANLMNAARIFVEADKLDRALAVFGPDFLKKNLAKADAVSRYASFWSSQNKNLESALEAAKKAVELTPDAFAVWNTLSQVHLKMKNYDEAIKAAQKAVDVAPTEQLKERFRKQIEQIKAEKEKK
jgi:tetratricopeptide (TPR) repeat protein